jgi:transposase-like protein
MFKVANRRGKSKIKISEKRKVAMDRILDGYSEDFNVKLSVIQELIPLGLGAVAKELQNEVRSLAGEKHSRDGVNARWGHQNGSVYLRDQKFPIEVPRVRNVSENREVRLETYERLQRPFDDDKGALTRLLHGLSTHKYHESAALAPEVFGISASNLSKKFKRGSAEKLRQLQTRSLSPYDIVAVFIDAKRYADDGIAVALGVTLEGRKVVLGIEHIHSEASRAVDQWLDKLLERGLRFEEGLLFIIDGSKGIRKAVEQKFGAYALIQRCRWHKSQNVIAYLDKSQQAVFKRRIGEAYSKTTYKEAKAELLKLHHELKNINVSAANSLEEGLEETLTIHRLGLSPELSRSLGTTNCIESLMSQMGAYTDKVDRWHNSDQILRWAGTGLMDIEPRLRRFRGYRYLNVLRLKLREMVAAQSKKNKTATVPELVEVN